MIDTRETQDASTPMPHSPDRGRGVSHRARGNFSIRPGIRVGTVGGLHRAALAPRHFRGTARGISWLLGRGSLVCGVQRLPKSDLAPQ
jgi:hypothetical protein